MKHFRSYLSLFIYFLALSIPQTVLAAAHAYVASEVVEPTCTKSGYTLYTCTDCGAVKKSDMVSKTGHDYQISDQTEPTCKKTGTLFYVCSRCSSTKKTSIPKIAHVYEEMTTEPTCTKAGKVQNICEGCGKKVTLQSLPALGHDFHETERTENTCGKSGSVLYTCKRCMKTRRETLDKLSHHFVQVTTPATCTKAGRIQDKCENCSKVKETVTIPALGHAFGEVQRTEATCRKAGSIVYTCENCGKTKKETIPKLTHTYEDVKTEPTCTKKGKIQTKCSICGNVCNTTTLPAAGHNYVETEVNGKTVKICSVCGKQ